MFERFTSGARTVVELAEAEARTMRHGYAGTEHLLLGLLGEENGIAAQTLRGAGLAVTDVRSTVQRLVERGIVTAPDAEALRTIGIDVEQVRARVEDSFGPGALERARLGRPRNGRWSGHIPFSPRSKKVLELSLREAVRLGHNYIGTEHILLALLREGEGLGAQVLAESGVRAEDLRRSVLAAIGKVA